MDFISFPYLSEETLRLFFLLVGFEVVHGCSLNVGTTLHILYISPTSNLRLPIGKADGILVRLQLGTELCLRTLPR